MKVSIIIPVYNSEKYLEECINSLLNQTYKNIEIILINDGSTDSSYEICMKYKKYDFIKIINQENQGVSAARNTGLKNATGEFIMFVDCDDYVANNIVEELLKNMSDCDMAICEYNELYKNTLIPIPINNKDRVINNKKAIELTFDSAGGYIWNKIFKFDIIKRNNILFDTNIHMLEDQLFVIEYLTYTNKVAITNKALYNYRIRKSSAVGNIYSQKYSTILISLKRINEIIDKLHIDDIIIKQKILEYSLKNKNNYIAKNIENYFGKDIKKIYKEFLNSNKVKFKSKLKIFVMKNLNFIFQIYINKKNKKYKLYE